MVPVTDSALDPDLDRMLVRHQYGAAERGVTRLSLFSLTWSAHQEIPKSAYFGSHEVAADLDDWRTLIFHYLHDPNTKVDISIRRSAVNNCFHPIFYCPAVIKFIRLYFCSQIWPIKYMHVCMCFLLAKKKNIYIYICMCLIVVTT